MYVRSLTVLLCACCSRRAVEYLRLEFFNKVFQFQNTVLQTVFPVILLFVLLKSVIWLMEANGFWVAESNLGELFAIIGFALGIVLSQKVAATYDKFLQVQEAVVRLTSVLSSLADILDLAAPGLGPSTPAHGCGR